MLTRELSADEFERHRAHLQRVARRLLGSQGDARDAVQETWIRVQHADASKVENVGGWLTTITARASLNALRTRHSRVRSMSSTTLTGSSPSASQQIISPEDRVPTERR